jgi:hypothetical protein
MIVDDFGHTNILFLFHRLSLNRLFFFAFILIFCLRLGLFLFKDQLLYILPLLLKILILKLEIIDLLQRQVKITLICTFNFTLDLLGLIFSLSS